MTSEAIDFEASGFTFVHDKTFGATTKSTITAVVMHATKVLNFKSGDQAQAHVGINPHPPG